MVIDNICKVVGGISVGLDQNHIVKFGIIDGNIAVDLIMEGRCACGRVILTNNIRLTLSKVLLNLFLGEMEAMLIIYGNVLLAAIFKSNGLL